MSIKKKVALAVTAVAMVGLLATGTFAWVNLGQSAINQFMGTGQNPGGTLHDDFDGFNKDVYVENWGTTPFFVRIKLNEYMEIGQGAGLKSKSSNNGLPVPNPDNHAIPLLAGALLDQPKTWQSHKPSAIGNPDQCSSQADFHKYWQWSMGGQKYYYPAPKSKRSTLVGNIEESNDYVDQSSPENIKPGSVNADGVAAKLTPNCVVITMAHWKSLNKPIGNYWVIDTDGWAYWASELKPQEATGLLLDKVLAKEYPRDSYYYAINVIAQMATKEGKHDDGSPNNYANFADKDNGGWTQDGKDLMDTLASKASTANGVAIRSDKPTIGSRIFAKAGDDIGLFAGSADNGVTWSDDGASGFSYNRTGDSDASVKVDPQATAGNAFAVTATSKSNTSESDEKTSVVMPNEAVGAVEGADGNPWVDFGDNTFQRINSDGSLGQLFCGGEDLAPGTGDDLANVAEINGDKHLGPNADGSFWGKGSDNLLGTSDDIKSIPNSNP
jgi:hypothetical protein